MSIAGIPKPVVIIAGAVAGIAAVGYIGFRVILSATRGKLEREKSDEE